MNRLAQKLMATLLFSLVLVSHARAATVSADIDKTRGSVDDQFVYTLTITGSPKSEPSIPAIDGLEIQPAGTSTSVQIINGSMSKSQEFRFVISPLRAGSFTIPAIKIAFDSGEEASLPIQLVVSDSGATGANGASKKSEVGWVEREFSTTTPYVGQVVMATTRFFTRARVMQYGFKPQVPSPLKRIPIEGERTYDRVIDGVRYQVVEVSEALIPLAPGKLEFSPAEFQAKIRLPSTGGRGRGGSPLDSFFDDPFFGGGRAQVKSFRTAAETLTVQALPTANRPPNFQAWVGEYSLQASLSQQALKVGETVTVSITVEGKGSLEGAADYILPTISDVKVYPDKPEKNQSIDRDNGIFSRAIFKFAVVPVKPGKLQIPPVEIAVFNPASQQYQILKHEFETIDVSGDAPVSTASGPESSDQRQVDVQQLSDDLLPWKSIQSIRAHTPSALDWRICLAMVLISAALTLMAGAWRVRQRLLDRNDPAARRQRAYKEFSSQLKHIPDTDPDACARLLKLTTRYFQAKFASDSAAMTADEIIQRLTQSSIEATALAEMKSILRSLEVATYGSASSDYIKVRQQLLDWIERMDARC